MTVRWERDHSLDSQLVWKGKDEEADVLEGDADGAPGRRAIASESKFDRSVPMTSVVENAATARRRTGEIDPSRDGRRRCVRRRTRCRRSDRRSVTRLTGVGRDRLR